MGLGSNIELSTEQLNYLNSSKSVRDSAKRIFKYSNEDNGFFKINLNKLSVVRDYVLKEIKLNYPDLNVPFHSRWRHFQVGGVDRKKIIEEKLSSYSDIEKLKSKLDLIFVSVLLDAGAGESWTYTAGGKTYSRSEGLAVASFDMFLNGDFSSESRPTIDSKALTEFNEESLRKGFQVKDDNPLNGVEGRVKLLNQLGELLSNSEIFEANRPSDFINHLSIKTGNEKIEAQEVLNKILTLFSTMWPDRTQAIVSGRKISLGDVWPHSSLDKDSTSATVNSLLAYHKLSQWLTYSLLESLIEFGVEILNINELTGLAEYRNGGLLIDLGLIELKDKSLLSQSHNPSSDLILEWRGLTIYFLDAIADEIRKELNLKDLELVKILEGGTWQAGRRIAAELREDMSPPIQIESDGTVF